MVGKELNDSNAVELAYQAYAMQHRHVDIDSFREDFNRCHHIPKLLRGFKTRRTINYRLLLNHTIILYNEFGSFATALLFLKTSEELRPLLRTLLQYTEKLPQVSTISGFEAGPIDISSYPINTEFRERLHAAMFENEQSYRRANSSSNHQEAYSKVS